MSAVRVSVVVCLLAVVAVAQSAPKLEGVGKIHHRVSSSNAEAQAYFDQGLALVYAFNHDEAEHAFARAAEIDPNLAMAQWGIALTYGANYNMPSMPDREKLAAEAMQKALALAPKASAPEQAYIQALSKRYSFDPSADLKKQAEDYAAAMRQLAAKYPDDLDAATLFAESMMNLHPWALWNHDGTPALGTEEIVRTLESVLKRDPNHTGANHYYIHAVEASPIASRALPSADRLGALAPSAGHLVHMPSHIYSRVGDFDAATRVNIAAAKADECYIERAKAGPGVYTLMYYSHNIHFEAYAASMEGNFAEAIAAARKLEQHVRPALAQMPMVEGFAAVPLQVLDRFHRYDDVLKMPAPAAQQLYETALWHYARGMAFASRGDIASAAQERTALAAAREKIPANAMAAQNPVRTIVDIAQHSLAGELARAKKDNATAESELKQAVAIQDGLTYIEPPEWFVMEREHLGNFYLATGKTADAERTFREDLERNPRNGRSLYGLALALRRSGNLEAAAEIDRQFQQAWQKADVKLENEPVYAAEMKQ